MAQPIREEKPAHAPRRSPAPHLLPINRSLLIEVARSDNDGHFVIGGLGRGIYLLTTRMRGYEVNKLHQVNAGTEGVNPALDPSARVIGRVVNDETGEPITRFSLAATINPVGNFIVPQLRQRFENAHGEFGDYNQSFTTDALGGFEAHGLQSGSYTLLVTQRKGILDDFLRPRYLPKAQLVSVEEGQTLEVDLRE